jgi:hypothetical protein
MKVIKQFEQLTVSGENIYHNADTKFYWNSISEANQAEIVPNSFENESKVKLHVPCCLPDHNKIVVCNSVGCYTGAQTYRYVGAPVISEFSPTSQEWGDEVTVKGNYFEDVTGVFVGETRVANHNWPSKRKLVFEVPHGIEEGLITIYTKVESATSVSKLTGVRPPINGTLINSPSYYNSSGLIDGESLDLINRVSLQGINNKSVLVEGNNLSQINTTGLYFNVPQGVKKDSSIAIQNVTGSFVGGEYQSSVKEELSLGVRLNLKSPYIDSFDSNKGAYQQNIRLSGTNLEQSKILFKGYDDSYIEGSFVNSGEFHKTVSVPKNIKTAAVMASGIGGGYTGKHLSSQNFFPIPTIVHMPANWVVGETVSIKAYNASEIVKTVGVSGKNLRYGYRGKFFVSNPESTVEGPDYFGYVTVDNSELSQNVHGFTRVTAVANSVMIGEGRAFLLASADSPERPVMGNLDSDLNNSYTYKNLDTLMYSTPVNISGKTPSVLGVSKPTSAISGQVNVSGRYFLPLTGVELYNSTESRVIPRSSLSAIGAYKIGVIPSGNANTYESPSYISIKIEDFNFTGKVGQFRILKP